MWRRIATLSAALLLSCTPPDPPAATMRSAPAALPRIQFERYTLANGLQVILHVDRKLPIVHVNQWFHVGGRDDPAGRTGFAHLFEHLMFQGSKNAGPYFPLVERAGANLSEGGVDGTTSFDRTNYFATVPSANLELLLWLESDRLATLVEAVDQKKLDGQRAVVANERRQVTEGRPYGRWMWLLYENLYPADHPYRRNNLKSDGELAAASLTEVTDFFRTHYRPNNLSLVIAGDFEPATARRLVARYFGGIPAGPIVDRLHRAPARLDGEKIVEVRDHSPRPRTYVVWPSPGFFEPGDAELDLASSILTDGLSARLNRALVRDRQLAADVVSFQSAGELAGQFVVWATARPGVSLFAVERALTEEIAQLARTGPTEAELARAKSTWEYQYVTGLERIGGFGGVADLLNQYNTFLGDPDRFDQDVARHRGATVETVRKSVARFLDSRDHLLIRFHPEEAAPEPAQAGPLDRTRRPGPGPERPFQPPAVAAARLPTGMEVFVVERHDLPKVAVTFTSRAGGVLDPPGKEGLADLAAAMLVRGTETRGALAIADEMGDLGASFSAAAEREYAAVHIELLRPHLDRGMTIVADLIRHPSFPQLELDSERALRLEQLAQEEADPGALARRIAPMLSFGRDHPYGRPLRGLPATVKRLTRADLAAFHRASWRASSSAIIFAGDIRLDEAIALARRHFGDWSGPAASRPAIEQPHPLGPGTIFLVDHEGATQTVIAQVLAGAPRKSGDRDALRLVDAVWGAGFGTRLNLNLREDKGYTYGIYSTLQFLNQAGAWRAVARVQTDKTAESVAEIAKELRGLAGPRPITSDELDYAKESLRRGYAQEFEQLGRIATQVAERWAAELPMTDLAREVERIQPITLDRVNQAARKYAVPSSATLLLVGDRNVIEPAIRTLDLGEIAILDAEGKPARADVSPSQRRPRND
jgi:zinc protease